MLDSLSKQSSWFYKLLLPGIVLSAYGGWMVFKSEGVTEQEKVSLSRVEQGKRPESRWVKASGYLLWDRAVEEVRKRGIDRIYVPFVSSDWQDGDKVAAFVIVNSLGADKFGDHELIEGTTGLWGMSSGVRGVFKNKVGIEIASNCLIIDQGGSPALEGRFGRGLLVVGLVLCGICVAMLVMNSEGAAKEGLYTQQRLAELRGQANAEGEVSRDDAIQDWLKDRGLEKAAAKV